MSEGTQGKIPQGWRRVCLGDVCQHSLGKMLDQQKNRGTLRPYLRNPNVQWFEFDLSDLKEMPFEDHEVSKYRVEPGDVIICEGGEAGRAAIWNGHPTEILIQKALHRVRTAPELYNRFLVYQLMKDARSGRLAEYFTGTTIPHLTGQDLHRYTFALPPLSEQQRIAAILDQADALRRKRHQALALTDQFLRSTFLDLFGDPVTNPKAWPQLSIGDIADVQGGLQVTAKRASNPVVVPYLRVANVFRDRLDLTEIKTMRVTAPEQARVALRSGDILVVEGHGNRDEIGRCAVWDGSITPCIHQNHLIRVRVHPNRALPEYVSVFLNSDAGRRQLFQSSNTTSGLNTISTSTVKDTTVLVPPLDEQCRFLAVLKRVNDLRVRLIRQSDGLARLFHALVQRAFRGEL